MTSAIQLSMPILQRGRSSRLVIRGNRNISAHLNIKRMLIITQGLIIRRLNPCPVHALFHLHILTIRRARTRLGQIVGVADIRLDIVRRGAAVGPVLKLEHREQTPDDGETRADEADRGLDVCPECCLVDGISRVGGADPEEDDDAVDTGEADEGSQGEDAV